MCVCVEGGAVGGGGGGSGERKNDFCLNYFSLVNQWMLSAFPDISFIAFRHANYFIFFWFGRAISVLKNSSIPPRS